MDLTILAFWFLLLAGTFIPETGNDFWLIRGQDYFKAFYAAGNILIIPILWLAGYSSWLFVICSVFSMTATIYAFLTIERFTRFSPKTVATARNPAPERCLKIYISNVYQYNRVYVNTLNQIVELDPDLVFLLETDQGWDEAMEEVRSHFPYEVKDIRNDTYGMILMSKIPLIDPQIHYRVKADIPSVETRIRIDGEEILIQGLHPKPPVPGEALFATKKDRELLRAALAFAGSEVKHRLLIGDLNDVAWSPVTRRFKRITGMKDPRQGRGFFATFPVWSPLRIPLDHVFCSPTFRLVQFKLTESTGSDHFPVFVEFEMGEGEG